MKKFLPLLFLLSSCVIFNKQLREEKKLEKFNKKAAASTAFLKDNHLLADTCHINFPCIEKDTIITSTDSLAFDSTLLEVGLWFQSEHNRIMDSMLNVMAAKDSSCFRVAQGIAQAYNEREIEFQRQLSNLPPKIIYRDRKILDSAAMQAIQDRMEKLLAAKEDALAQCQNKLDDTASKLLIRTHQRNILFLILLTIILVAFRKPIIGLFTKATNPVGAVIGGVIKGLKK